MPTSGLTGRWEDVNPREGWDHGIDPACPLIRSERKTIMRIGSAIEFVAVMAAGMAFARWETLHPYSLSGNFTEGFRAACWVVSILMKHFLFGVGLAGWIGLLIERARGHHPEVWGIGRWSWSLVASFSFFLVVWRATGEFMRLWAGHGSIDINYLLFHGSDEVARSIRFPDTCVSWSHYAARGGSRGRLATRLRMPANGPGRLSSRSTCHIYSSSECC